jgi:excisionase family DNA binding protein
MMVSDFYTPQELAKRLKVTPQAIHNWITAGKIASIKFGRARRIPVAEVERIIREGIQEGKSEQNEPQLVAA